MCSNILEDINMKRLIKKGISFSISETWLAVFCILLLAIMLFPILRLAFYAVPWYDDYSYAVHVKRFIAQDGILKGAFSGALYVVRTWWYCWQGTFSSIFMMSLMPEAFGEGLYPAGIIGIILFFVTASLLFVKVVLGTVLKAEKAIQISVAVLITLTMVELIYTAQQGIYWYNAAVHYTFMHGCLFLLLAAAIKLIYAQSKISMFGFALIVAVFAFVCSGSNFVTALQGGLVLGLLMVLGFVFRKKSTWFLIPAAFIYGVGFYMNVSAPGNAVRGAYYQGFGAVESVILSFRSGVLHFWEFTGIITFIILGVYVLMIWNTIRQLRFAFPLPLAVSIVSFGLYCTGFTSSYYGMGTEGLARTWVVVKFTLQLLLFVNVTYWLGWGMQQCRKKNREIPFVKQWVWLYIFAGCAMVLWLVFNPNQAGSCASYGAYYYVHTGEAYNIQQEYRSRVETIKNSEQDIVEVEPYVWKPWFLYKGELSTDMTAEPNMSMADWFDKKGIYVKE